MSGRYRFGLIGALILQVALLGWMIADRALLLRDGKEIRLAVVPVDPRDLFRGDYVVLRYGISSVQNTLVDGDNIFNYGDPIYVSIAAGPDGWAATALHEKPPAEGTFLRGNIVSVAATGACNDMPDCNTYEVEYNLEQFFVPEGTGRELETLRNDQKVSVDVAVAASGQAVLKRLLVDGEPRYQEGLY